jgi:hypothetical protein
MKVRKIMGTGLPNRIPEVPSPVVISQRMKIQDWSFHLVMCMRRHGMCQAWFWTLEGQWGWRKGQSDEEEVCCTSVSSYKR